METKKCNKCYKEKEATLDNFYKQVSMADGLQGTCKKCHSEAIKIDRPWKKQKGKRDFDDITWLGEDAVYL